MAADFGYAGPRYERMMRQPYTCITCSNAASASNPFCQQCAEYLDALPRPYCVIPGCTERCSAGDLDYCRVHQPITAQE